MILSLLINLVYANKTRTTPTTKNPNKYYVFQGVFELENPDIKHLDYINKLIFLKIRNKKKID